MIWGAFFILAVMTKKLYVIEQMEEMLAAS
jgi:hypothetical protein